MCRSLGYKGGTPTKESQFGPVPRDMVTISCTGGESSLNQCQIATTTSCQVEVRSSLQSYKCTSTQVHRCTIRWRGFSTKSSRLDESKDIVCLSTYAKYFLVLLSFFQGIFYLKFWIFESSLFGVEVL